MGGIFNPVQASGAKTGSYAGNNSVNRAIPHALGSTPAWITIVARAGEHLFNIADQAEIHYMTSGAGGVKAVTVPNSTNFYVGEASAYSFSANATGTTYDWIAW